MHPSRFLRLLFPALLSVCLTACEYSFSLKDGTAPKIFVHCVAADGETHLLVQYAAPAYGHSKTVFDFHPTSVVLTADGTPLALEEDAERPGLLHSSAALRPGEQVRVEVTADGMPSVSGTSTVPPLPVISGLSLEEVQQDTLSATRVTLLLDHAPAEGEYYGLQIRTHTEDLYLEDGKPGRDSYDGYSAPGQAFYGQELARIDLSDYIQVDFTGGLISGMAAAEPLAILSADKFDGAAYSFYMDSPDLQWIYDFADRSLPGEGGWDPEEFRNGDGNGDGNGGETQPERILLYRKTTGQVILHRLSKEFWYYAKAQYQSNFDFLANMGLIPANFTWSNIRDGIGMIGAISTVRSEPFVIETEFPVPQGLQSSARSSDRATAAATLIPSRALDTMPPAYPAPSPHG